MKYKEGDKVRIKSLDWYNENKTSEGCLVCGSSHINPEMICMLGKIVTISSVEGNHYRIKEYGWNWTDEMIEGLVEEETKPTLSKNAKLVSERFAEDVNVSEFKPHQDEIMKLLLQGALNVPEGYIFKDENGNVIPAKKIVLEKKKPKYPQTYEECCNVLNLGEDGKLYTKGYNASIIQSFQKLLICRDAYWKIAGDEMGLGKSWEPDWEDKWALKHYIGQYKGKVEKETTTYSNHILSFPTVEIRDTFKESEEISKLIEECKELI